MGSNPTPSAFLFGNSRFSRSLEVTSASAYSHSYSQRVGTRRDESGWSSAVFSLLPYSSVPSHQRKEIEAALRPSSHEVALASEVILATVAKEQLASAAHLRDAVAVRLRDEPGPNMDGLEGVQEDDLRRTRASWSTALALAHLESTGHLLPYGPRRIHDWQHGNVPYRSGGLSAGYVMDLFNFELADVYVLPLTGLAPELDTPAVFLDHLPPSMGSKVRRVLFEATQSYRAGLFVGAEILLATASEAAWEQVGVAIAKHTSDRKLNELLADPLSSAAQVQARTLDLTVSLKLGSAASLAGLDSTARTYRELRNHAVHEPQGSFDEALFARAAVGTMLVGAVSYFQRLYGILEKLSTGVTQ